MSATQLLVVAPGLWWCCYPVDEKAPLFMSALENVHAQAQVCLSETDEVTSQITAVKSIVEEHIDRSTGVGSETQVTGGQGLNDELEAAMSLLEEARTEIEGVSDQAQQLQD